MTLNMPRVPMCWDPAFVILICCDRLLGVCARECGEAVNIQSVSDGNHILVKRLAVIFNKSGQEVGSASASSHGYRDGNILVSRSQLLSARFNIELLEKVSKIQTPYTASMIPFGEDMSLLTSAYSFTTDRGNEYKGYTVYPYKFPNVKAVQNQQMLTIESVNFNRSEKRFGETEFYFEMTSRIEQIAAI